MTARAGSCARGEDGVVLILFAMLAFGLFAMAAVYVDLAQVKLTQNQMRTAVENAALEGLRFRDIERLGRRVAAFHAVADQFDDDLNSNNATTFDTVYGAGPLYTVSGGATELNAGALIQLGFNRVWKPQQQMQINADNFVHGDMVAGTYVPPPPGVGSAEVSTYHRNDFVPSAAGQAALSAPSFLVRLRRTNDLQGFDREPGVSSAGPTVPFLFGMGAMISKVKDAQYNPRSDGVTVRATAIADSVRALRVSNTIADLPGGLTDVWAAGSAGSPLNVGFAIDVTIWEQLIVRGPGGEITQRVSIVLQDDGSGRLEPPALPGFFVGALAGPSVALRTVGDAFSPTSAPLPPLPNGEVFFVPLYEPSIGNRVIGFAIGAVEIVGPFFRITPGVQFMFSTGVSAHSIPARQALANIPGLAAAHAQFSESALAPILVR